MPYSVKVVAGGGTAGASGWTAGETCPVSGYTSTDIYGDGCLGTEISLTGPRTAVADVNGNVFFTDYTNGLVRRVDAVTGIVSTVAGGVSAANSPGLGAACATGATTNATDAKGDGCLGTQVYLTDPIGLVFSAAGNLYFTELGSTAGGSTVEKIFGADVREIAATNGLIPASGGAISMVDGALSSYTNAGYSANNYSATPPCSPSSLTNCIVAATSSYLYEPYGLAYDNNNNLYITEEYKEAVLVVNLSANTNTLFSGTANAVVIPAGTVAKIVGDSTTGGSTCPNGDSGTTGCNYPSNGEFTVGASANSSMIDSPYAVTVDPSGNVYFSNEYPYDVPEVLGTGSSAGNINLYAGQQSVKGTITAPVTTREAAGSFAIGNTHGVTVDTNSNVYIADAGNGVVWRVDGAGQSMYPVAGGAATLCTSSIVPGVTTIDSYGDGCAATSAKFGTGTTGGVFGLSLDAYSDLFVGDTVTGLVREVASGTQFGPIGANEPTQKIEIHFAAGDSPASSSPYSLTAGAANFMLGSATCTKNSDNTDDCVLAITATPSVVGPFTGMVEVTSALGATASFPLSGDFVASPLTRTVVTAAQAAECANTMAYSNTTPVILTATIVTSGANPPGGTVTFYANGTQIGTPQDVNDNAATLTYTFSTTGMYAITATYSGDSYYKTSTSPSDSITSSTPSLGATAEPYQQNTVNPGQTGLYSFNLQQNVYTGTITFSCSGLPANSSCVFSPSSFTANGCQTSNTIAMSILTQQGSTVSASSIGWIGSGPWRVIGMVAGFGLALLIGIRRRRAYGRFGQLFLALALLLGVSSFLACNSIALAPATPAGTYTVTVTSTGSNGGTSSFTVPFTVK